MVTTPDPARTAERTSRSNLTPPDGSDYLIGIGGPDEGLGDVVALCDKELDQWITAGRSKNERNTTFCDDGGGQDAHPIFVCPWRRSVANRR